MAVCHYLASRGFFFWKNPSAGYFDAKLKRFRKHRNPYTRNGVPDIIVILDGKFIGLELKTRTGRQSDAQKDFEILLKKHGGHYHLVRSVKDVEALFPSCQ